MRLERKDMWSHDEQKEISNAYIMMARVRCTHCGSIVKKYVESHYTGGTPCVLLAKYCRYCNKELNNQTKF